MATWGEVKAQAATMLGIQLTDYRRRQRAAAPHRRTTATSFPAPTGYAAGHHRHRRRRHSQYGRRHRRLGQSPAAPVNLDGRGASAPTTPSSPTSRTTRCRSARSPTAISPIGLANPGNGDTEYDNELLDAHFIAGDGRVNENIGLTAVHHVFHAEHNRLVEHTKEVVARRSGDACRSSTNGCSVRSLTDRCRRRRARRSASAGLGWRAPVPGRQVRHRDAVSASRVRGVRAQDPAEDQCLRRSGRVRHHHQSVDRRRIRPCGLSLRPLHAAPSRSTASIRPSTDQNDIWP